MSVSHLNGKWLVSAFFQPKNCERGRKGSSEAKVLIESQKKLDESIISYKEEVSKIDSNISNIKIKKEVVNNFYGQKQKEIKDANTKQIDSMFRSRYNY